MTWFHLQFDLIISFIIGISDFRFFFFYIFLRGLFIFQLWT